jgi:E2 domain of amyloid precursor protein
MKDWSDLEERYQDMRLADPKSAQAFKQKMTARFQVVKNSNIGAHEDIKEINFVFFCPFRHLFKLLRRKEMLRSINWPPCINNASSHTSINENARL